MTPADAAELLALAAAFDRRTVGEADARAWTAALHAMPLDDDAHAAVARHYAETDRWITPAHVRQQRAKIRAERIAQANVFDDGRPEETPGQFLARRRALTAAIANGQTAAQAIGLSPSSAPRALTGGPAPEIAEHLTVIGCRIPADIEDLLDEHRPRKAARRAAIKAGQSDALAVLCTWCGAAAGTPCVRRIIGPNRQHGARKVRAVPHPTRIERAALNGPDTAA